MGSREHQKSCTSNLLVSVIGDIKHSCIIDIIKIFFTAEKDLS